MRLTRLLALNEIMKSEKKIIGALLKKAGIAIDGGNSYDIQIHNEDLYRRVLQQGSLGLGESYMEGWWDCESLEIGRASCRERV